MDYVLRITGILALLVLIFSGCGNGGSSLLSGDEDSHGNDSVQELADEESSQEECTGSGPSCLGTWKTVCENGFVVRVADCAANNEECVFGLCIPKSSDGDEDKEIIEADVDADLDDDPGKEQDFQEIIEEELPCSCGPAPDFCCDGCNPIHEMGLCIPNDANAISGYCDAGACRVDGCKDGYTQTGWFTCLPSPTDGDYEAEADIDPDPDCQSEDGDTVDLADSDFEWPLEEEIVDIDELVDSEQILEEEPDDPIQECFTGACCANNEWVPTGQPCVSGQDGFSCTDDLCTDAHECGHFLKDGFCLINGECLLPGSPSQDLECRECTPLLDPIWWSVSPDETQCDDGNPTTENDRCHEGICLGEGCTCNQAGQCCDGCHPINESGSCSDGSSCTNGDICQNGSCIGIPVDCAGQLNPCLETSCNPATGNCDQPKPNNTPCDNSTLCDGRETCQEAICSPGNVPDCHVDDPCKVGYCDPTQGCLTENLEDTTPCDDDNLCNGRETCHNGTCQPGSPPECGISAACIYGLCDPLLGCLNEDIPDGTPCPDNDPCNGIEFCMNGTCSPGNSVSCQQPAQECLVATCTVGVGCQTKAVEDGTPCEDGNALTTGDYCSGGQCVAGESINLPVSFVPATGLTLCYNDTIEIPCGDPGSSYSGQDADIASPPMQYTQVGSALRAADAPILKDEVTGLFWQRDSSTTTYNFQQATNYCVNLVLGGRDDWRLPNRRELLSLVDYSRAAGQVATIDPLFTNTMKNWYWTSDVTGTNPDRYWRVSFKWGTSDHQDYSIADGYVRCVAGTASFSQESLFPIEIEDGVYDPSTGLMWQRSPSGYLPWQAALDYCDNLNQINFQGWRLPNVKELSMLLRAGHASPVLDPEIFPGIRAGQVFWTSTTYNDPTMRNNAYIAGLGDIGTLSKSPKTSNYRVMCVRSCPCPDPKCCQKCIPLNISGCDDDDPTTVRDTCREGLCIGDPVGTPAPNPQSPYDCQVLDCGPGGTCLKIDGLETCRCNPGFKLDGSTCIFDPSSEMNRSQDCNLFDNGIENVCLLNRFDLISEPNAADQSNSLARSKSSPSQYFVPATKYQGKFFVHGQHGSQWCLVHSINAGIELQLKSSYIPLSEAHSLFVGFDTTEVDACRAITPISFIDNLERDGVYFVPDQIWDIDYTGNPANPCPDINLETKPSDAVLSSEGRAKLQDWTNLIGQNGSVDLGKIKTALSSNHPVVIGVPVIARPQEWFTWTGSWPVITNQAWTRNRTKKCSTTFWFGRSSNPEECRCDEDQDCIDIQAGNRCIAGVCTLGGHAVLLIGYNDSESNFWLLNSWDTATSHWGASDQQLGYPAGLAKISYDFVQNRATFVGEINEVRLKCADETLGACQLNSLRCDPNTSGNIQKCSTDSQNGCHVWKYDHSCDTGMVCQGAGSCAEKCGNGWCRNGENCLTCPADCACTSGKSCNASGQCVASCGSDACQPNEVGCADNDTRWWCGLLPGDSCLDQIPVNCAAHEKCEGGACVTDCNTPRLHHKDCKLGTNEVWWYNWCDQITDYVETCSSGETCESGICQVNCAGSGPKICYNDDEYLSDLCGNPTTRQRDCGVDGYVGSPGCSDDGLAIVKQYCDKGCSGNACFSNCRQERTECPTGVPCLNGVCTTSAAQCGDHICTPTVENCANCPADCTCWSDDAPVCTTGGQCVQCLQDSDCSQGYTCNTGTRTCQSGCNECGPVGTHRCVSSSSRQTCQLVGNCNKWVTDNCGSGYACCQGDCVSTTPPDPPTLVSPAAGANVTAGTVHFEWQRSTGMTRATLKVCTTQNLQGNCPIVEETPAGYTYLNRSLTQGTYWWSARGITTCDASGWGDFATPRQVIVGTPPTPDTCNGLDDDGDGRIDNVGAVQMACMREIFHFVRTNDSGNYRLQWNGNGGVGTPGIAPAAPSNYQDPAFMATEGRHPSFLLYHDSYGISGLTKLYWCFRDQYPFDNLYTTNWQAECGSYAQKGENNYIGYIFTSDPGSSNNYATWLYSPYYGSADKTSPLWRIRKPSTNQHMFTAFEPTITDRVSQGWCCERGPAYACNGHWCGSVNTNPVGWVLTPR